MIAVEPVTRATLREATEAVRCLIEAREAQGWRFIGARSSREPDGRRTITVTLEPVE